MADQNTNRELVAQSLMATVAPTTVVPVVMPLQQETRPWADTVRARAPILLYKICMKHVGPCSIFCIMFAPRLVGLCCEILV